MVFLFFGKEVDSFTVTLFPYWRQRINTE